VKLRVTPCLCVEYLKFRMKRINIDFIQKIQKIQKILINSENSDSDNWFFEIPENSCFSTSDFNCLVSNVIKERNPIFWKNRISLISLASNVILGVELRHDDGFPRPESKFALDVSNLIWLEDC